MNNEKLHAIFEEVSLLTDQLNAAIQSANKLADLNADSNNVTQIIRQFESLNTLVDARIEDVNRTTKVFSKNVYMAVGLVFLIALIMGSGLGYFLAQKAFIRYVQDDLIKEQAQAIVRSNTAIEKEWGAINGAKIARNNGVIFYKNGIIIPAKKESLQEEKNNKTAYIYTALPRK
ncbi:MAG: hypothetical protein K9L22_08380 [Methylococcaceae bacterium]|nr:hypothetical protein [Methylococcaceae bacterium]